MAEKSVEMDDTPPRKRVIVPAHIAHILIENPHMSRRRYKRAIAKLEERGLARAGRAEHLSNH